MTLPGLLNNHLPALLLIVLRKSLNSNLIRNHTGHVMSPTYTGALTFLIVSSSAPTGLEHTMISVHSPVLSLPSLPFVSPTSAALGRRSSDRWHPATAVAMVISDKRKHHPRSIDYRMRRLQEMGVQLEVELTDRYLEALFKSSQIWGVVTMHWLKDAIFFYPS